MKKLLISTLFILCIATLLFGQTPRVYYQKIVLPDSMDILDIVTNPTPTHCPAYRVMAFIVQNPMEIISTDTHPTSQIRINRLGNGTSVPYYAAAFVQLAAFPTQWIAGEILHVEVTYLQNQETTFWEFTIMAGTAQMIINDPVQIVPPTTGIRGNIRSYFPIAGIEISCTGQDNVTTAEDGYYEFCPLPQQTITVTPQKENYAFYPPSRTYNSIDSYWLGQDFQMVDARPVATSNPTPSNHQTGVSAGLEQVSWHCVNDSVHITPSGFKVYFPAESPDYHFVPYTGAQSYFYPIVDTLVNVTTYTWKVVTTAEPTGFDADSTEVWSFTTEPYTAVSDNETTPRITGFYINSSPSCNTTGIFYTLNKSGNINISIYNLKGQLVHRLDDGYKQTGSYRIIWNRNDEHSKPVAPGMYLIVLHTDNKDYTQKLILLK